MLTAVIGANYGDEGKGRVVDWLNVHRPAKAVVRYSGSGQAAHTVQLENGVRHVHRHHGSGTLRGSETMMTSGCLINPMVFCKETEELEGILGYKPVAYADLNCPIVLPTDMIINQASEIRRREVRSEHGSCGFGVGAAVERGTYATLRVTFENALMMKRPELDRLMMHHLTKECEIRGWDLRETLDLVGVESMKTVGDIQQDHLEKMSQDLILDRQSGMMGFCELEDHVIFESSQGLGLDPMIGKHPHVTWSDVGLAGLLRTLGDNFMTPLRLRESGGMEVIYCTRAYLTRHGEGPLENSLGWEPDIVDPTNKPNQWQGSLRGAALNFQTMHRRIVTDRSLARVIPRFYDHTHSSVAITCLDQVPEDVPFVDLFGQPRAGKSYLIQEARNLVRGLNGGENTGRLILCSGPTASDTKIHEREALTA